MSETITPQKIREVSDVFSMLAKLKDQALMETAIHRVLADIDHWCVLCKQQETLEMIYRLTDEPLEIHACWQSLKKQVQDLSTPPREWESSDGEIKKIELSITLFPPDSTSDNTDEKEASLKVSYTRDPSKCVF